jgi:hypothetical protein
VSLKAKSAGLVTALAMSVAFAGSALADMPPYCPMDAGNPALSQFDGYTPYQSEEGFVSLTMHGQYREKDSVLVLQNCASGQQLVAIVRNQDRNEALVDAVYKQFNDMMRSDTPYTMAQMRDALKEQGARATLSRFSGQSCGCKLYYPDSAGATQ